MGKNPEDPKSGLGLGLGIRFPRFRDRPRGAGIKRLRGGVKSKAGQIKSTMKQFYDSRLLGIPARGLKNSLHVAFPRGFRGFSVP